MSKGNNAVKTLKDLSNYKFDTSSYIILKDGLRREASTGNFINSKSVVSTTSVQKSKKQ